MDLLIVGSVAYDTIKTPFGKKEKLLGGSAVYASLSASILSKPGIIGVVGNDFEEEHCLYLKSKNINIDGLEKADGKTFEWSGEYKENMASANTIYTRLNAFEFFNPKLNDLHKSNKFLFLANIDPDLQLSVLNQIKNSKFALIDTMNFWIEKKKEKLLEAIKKTNAVSINDAEARQLTGEYNLIKAGFKLQKLGPELILIKKGENGTIIFYKGNCFIAPAYPTIKTKDPTGAGDSFAGAFLSYIAKKNIDGNIDFNLIKKATVYGNIVASFTVEDWGIEKLKQLKSEDIKKRIDEFKKLISF